MPVVVAGQVRRLHDLRSHHRGERLEGRGPAGETKVQIISQDENADVADILTKYSRNKDMSQNETGQKRLQHQTRNKQTCTATTTT